MLVGWVDEYKKREKTFFQVRDIFMHPTVNVNLRKELVIVREERDILKKTLGIFSSVQK